MNIQMPPIQTMTPAEAAGVASVLRMIADELTLTASSPNYGPLVKRRIDDTVEHLIELSDYLSGDCDLESTNDDEPYLGWASSGPSALDACDDREQDAGDDPEAGDGDIEKTAIETHGRGFPRDITRDDDEDSHDQEAIDEREGYCWS